MKFAFFSHGITQRAANRMAELVEKRITETRVVLITTAQNVYPPNQPWMLETENEFKNYGFQIEKFDLEKAYKEKINIEEFLKKFDIVYVCGGNTFYLVYYATITNFKEIMTSLLKTGKLYAGGSAGVVCNITDLTPIALIDDPKVAPKAIYKGLELSYLIVIPHWGNPEYQDKLEEVRDYYLDRGLKTTLLEDGDAVFQIDNNLEFITK